MQGQQCSDKDNPHFHDVCQAMGGLFELREIHIFCIRVFAPIYQVVEVSEIGL